MVVTAIFVILTGVVLANNSRFSSRILLQNLASDIALSIREAQVYGIAVRRCDPTITPVCVSLNDNAFDLAYGVHFVLGDSVTPSRFELFADVDNSATYDPGETILSTTLASGYQIAGLSVFDAVSGSESVRTELNIAFRRPEPDACIEGEFDLAESECLSTYGRARIVVRANNGDESTITVESTGQISVQ